MENQQRERWNAVKNVKFIYEYRRHECLWDLTNPLYKSREARNAAYKAIMNAMEMDCTQDVVSKIRILRNTYTNEALKATKNESYVSKIPWLKYFDFIKHTDGNNLDTDYFAEIEHLQSECTRERWNAELNIHFINEYKLHDCLWNPKNPLYKNREASYAAYKKIMNAMGMECTKEVVTKIRVLRNTYNNEALKAIKDESYVSKIPWLKYLDFIKQNDNCKDEYFTPNDTTQDCSSTESFLEVLITPTPPIMPSKTNKRKLEDPLIKDSSETELSQHLGTSNSTSNDEFDYFGQTIAAQLRTLPLEIALETEEMLLSTIRKQRIKAFKLMQHLSNRTSESGLSNIIISEVKGESSLLDEDSVNEFVL